MKLKSIMALMLTSIIAAGSLNISAYSNAQSTSDIEAEAINLTLSKQHYVETDARSTFNMNECIATLSESSDNSASNPQTYTLQVHDEVRIYTTEELGADYSWTTVLGSGSPDCASITVKSDGMYIVAHHPETEFLQVTIGSNTEYFLVTIYLADTVHRIDNAINSLRIKDNTTFYENKKAQLYTADSTSILNNDDLFKIVSLGNNLYCLRSMVNSSMALCKSGDDIVFKTIGTSESSIPNEAKWYIRASETSYGRFYIYHSSDKSDTLTSSNNASDGSYVQLAEYTTADTYQNWYVEEYIIPTGSEANFTGVVIPNKISKLGIGEKYKLSADIYSYKPAENGQNGFTWSVTNGTGSATIDSNGILTGVSKGTVTVTATYKQTSYSTSITISITNPITDGTYYIRNARTNKYLTYDENETNIALGSASYSSEQQWELVLNSNGYYNISSADGSSYINYSGSGSDLRIIKGSYTSIYSDWCIIKNGSAYNILPRAMAESGNIMYNTEEDTLIETYSALTTDSRGLWKLIRVTT